MLCNSRNPRIGFIYTNGITCLLYTSCQQAEILVAAAGKAKMLDDSYVGENTTVIDVGINVDENGKLCGDAAADTLEEKSGKLTPVPGGVGAVTTAVLAKHLVQAALRK